ncbi:MAG: hypothetical protein KGL29_07005 [Alphaproteobacteria bacterium]|nr:hypothetical protein [Alphaproteobacteria bacterium]
MSRRPPITGKTALPTPANDNDVLCGPIVVKVLIPSDLPITQTEIEVLAALIEDCPTLAANDNEDLSK